jgi:hypothetical protein
MMKGVRFNRSSDLTVRRTWSAFIGSMCKSAITSRGSFLVQDVEGRGAVIHRLDRRLEAESQEQVGHDPGCACPRLNQEDRRGSIEQHGRSRTSGDE